MKAFFLRTAAIFFIILGIIGAVLPIMPTVPFLLAALYLGSGDPAIKKYIAGNRLLSMYLPQDKKLYELPQHKKLMIAASLLLPLLITSILIDSLWYKLMAAAIGAAVIWYLAGSKKIRLMDNRNLHLSQSQVYYFHNQKSPTSENCMNIKLMTIGNSFADSVFHYLPQIVEGFSDCNLLFDRSDIGGCSLERHWQEHLANLQNPAHRAYDNKHSLQENLTSVKWDIVTIQQASHFSWQIDSFQPYFDNLFHLIRSLAPQAEIIIQQTWSYRADDPRLRPGGEWQIDNNEMYRRLTENYLQMAKEYNLRIIPTGLAVQLARQNDPQPFKLYNESLLKTLRWPDLPPQAGDPVGSIFWRKHPENGELFLASDYIHLNCRGDYLQACLWFSFLFNRRCSEIKFEPDCIGRSDAEFLRNCAQTALDTFSV